MWHRGVLHKLEKSGISGNLLKWFESYLTERKQCVLLNGCRSSIRNLNAGVPQGSILGPMFFLIYINDLVDVVKTGIRLYADDSTLFVISDSPEEAAEALNEDLVSISNWARDWFVTFNADKTISLNFCRNKQRHLPSLYMNDTEIQDSIQHKHLGCILQNNAKWNRHIEGVVTKCSRRIGILKGLQFQLDRHTLEILYKAFIKPIMDYASAVWINCTGEQQNELEKLQLSALRVITGAIKGTSHHKIYEESHFITTIESRHRRHLLLFYKIYHGHSPSTISSLLPHHTRQQSDYNLRNKNQLALHRARTEMLRNSFIPSMTKTWNDLEDSIKYIGSIHDFKSHLRKDDTKPPPYYYAGDRRSQIYHTRMRMGCSSLRNDLFNMKIIDRKDCDCGHPTEDASHYLFSCPNYAEERIIFQDIDNGFSHDSKTFLFGDRSKTVKQNTKLFVTICQYIKNTKRF